MTRSEIAIARRASGYRPPVDERLCCKNCGACRKYAHYYCLRHGYFVHSRAVCSDFDPKPFAAPPKPKPLFVQEEMF